MRINIEKKFYSFNLASTVINSKYKTYSKSGWIIKLKNQNNAVGYGEISPLLSSDIKVCEKEINQIPKVNEELKVLENIKKLHPCIQSGFNSAIAEMNGEIDFKKCYPFYQIDQTAILLQTNQELNELKLLKNNLKYKNKNLTIKWKVGIKPIDKEEKILEKILNEIPINFKLRIDANCAWCREIANKWAEILNHNKNLDWLEQPLAAEDIEGLRKLNTKIPIALDESLIRFPTLIDTWEGWQIRRPSQECNPLKLMKELVEMKRLRSISSSFEIGIGRRLLFHFSLLQQRGPNPVAPGLALRQTPKSFLFSDNPHFIWEQL